MFLVGKPQIRVTTLKLFLQYCLVNYHSKHSVSPPHPQVLDVPPFQNKNKTTINTTSLAYKGLHGRHLLILIYGWTI